MLVVGLPSCRSSPSTYIWPSHQKGKPSTHIWSCSKLQSHQKGPALTFTSTIGIINYHLWNGSALIYDLLVRMAQYSHPSRLDHIRSQWWESSALPSRLDHIHSQWWKIFSLSSRLEPYLLTRMKDSHPGWITSAHNDERFVHSHLTW